MINESKVVEGLIIGGVGGFLAGGTLFTVKSFFEKYSQWKEANRVYKWMSGNTIDEHGKRFRTTRTIASWNNLTEDRVRFICSNDDRLFLSTGENEDLWSIYEHSARPKL